ncbi:MAG TPA: NAD(P)H-dependent glycerol-3-phosphate dehydrogenase [Candidatus Kapabacteria bacterium]|nr:NAD(P)H-dependent glycerol-3-phosphate dehydrogenase [Candidatus Kapabacteria bacterium]
MRIGCIGAGSWGTTLAVHLAQLGHDVALWAHGAPQRERLRSDRENRLYLAGVPFPSGIAVCDSVEEVVEASDPLLLIATPTQHIRTTLTPLASDALSSRVIVSTSKGIEQGSLLRISELFEQLWDVGAERFVSLSGPSHAEEVSRGIPTTVVAASTSRSASELVQDVCSNDTLRVYTNDDLIGVELGGALKNVIAVCAGIIDGLGYGDNTKAALITRGLAEITRLGVALGASASTFSGLAGLGDLVVTCFSRHSRNRFVGEQIGRGRRLADVVAEMNMVAEGVTTTESAHQLAQRHGVEMPIINEVYRILFAERDPRTATLDLMRRRTKHELWT